MSAEIIIQHLLTLIKLHKSFNEIAKSKTQVMIEGDIEKLKGILSKENKHTQAIQTVSQQIVEESKRFLTAYQKKESSTISEVIQYAQSAEKEKLVELKHDLEQQIIELQNQNEINQELLQQSLDFVHQSLDILMPDIESLNYSSNEENRSESRKEIKSIFDSKA